ncbi:MAG TPA: hypothetical protein VGK43_06570 [Solirubrobacterales bacterium]
MRRILFVIALVLAALALPSHGAIKACNASRVSAGDCTSAGTQTILLYAFETTVLVEFADELAELYGWPTIVCTSADVTAGRCSSGQLGQAVTTPETKNQFANRMLSEEIRRRVHNRRKRLAAAAAEAGATQPGAID